MASAGRLLTRTQLRIYLGDLPWAMVKARIEAGKLPGPLWRLDLADKDARWDLRAVDRALDAESGIPGSIEQQVSEVDRALGFS